MPKTVRRAEDFFGQSIRFDADEVAWIRFEEARRGTSFTDVVREAAEDRRTLYGLPRDQMERLLADALQLGYRHEPTGKPLRREYIRHLLSLAYQRLLQEEERTGKRIADVEDEETVHSQGEPEFQDFATSVRFPIEMAAWVKEEALIVGSYAAVVREALNDRRLLYGLPIQQVRKLNAEAARLGLNRRTYVQHIIAQRYEEVFREDLRASARKPLSKR